jgi:gliding motility-associated-like protein
MRIPACGVTEIVKNVTVVDLPAINLGDDLEICPGSDKVQLKSLSGTAERYQWNTGDNTSSINVGSVGEFILTGYNWECSNSDTISVKKGCFLNIPNSFNPGSGDASSSYFMPRNLFTGSATTFKMQVYDRWGTLLFESTSLDGRGWDGKYQGKDMPVGVYVYTINVSFSNGTVENYTGNVTLIR